jgi:hypothetical protein
VFVLQGHVHTQSLSLVGELKANAAMRPLVNFLVVGMPNIVVLPDIAHITYDQRLHSCLMQSGDKLACLLVLDILDLVLDLL